MPVGSNPALLQGQDGKTLCSIPGPSQLQPATDWSLGCLFSLLLPRTARFGGLWPCYMGLHLPLRSPSTCLNLQTLVRAEKGSLVTFYFYFAYLQITAKGCGKPDLLMTQLRSCAQLWEKASDYFLTDLSCRLLRYQAARSDVPGVGRTRPSLKAVGFSQCPEVRSGANPVLKISCS